MGSSLKTQCTTSTVHGWVTGDVGVLYHYWIVTHCRTAELEKWWYEVCEDAASQNAQSIETMTLHFLNPHIRVNFENWAVPLKHPPMVWIFFFFYIAVQAYEMKTDRGGEKNHESHKKVHTHSLRYRASPVLPPPAASDWARAADCSPSSPLMSNTSLTLLSASMALTCWV